MTHILHRAANAVLPVAVSGSGVEIVDASGGAAVSCLGHGHPNVLAAKRKRLDALAYALTAFFTTEVAERLADRLVEALARGLMVCPMGGATDGVEGDHVLLAPPFILRLRARQAEAVVERLGEALDAALVSVR